MPVAILTEYKSYFHQQNRSLRGQEDGGAKVESRVAELVIYWDDNNGCKPRTTVTTLVTLGAVLYIGGGRSAY